MIETITEDDRQTIIDALNNYRKWFDNKRNKQDYFKIDAIDSALDGIKNLNIPGNKEDCLDKLLSVLEELDDFEWTEDQLPTNFFKRFAVEIENLMNRLS